MMVADLPPYRVMKDSGVEWLGEVPEDWRVRRLKSLMGNVVDSTGSRSPGQLYLALEHVESWTGRIRPVDPGAVFDSQVKRFRAGDILFGKLRPYLAKVTRPERDGVCVGEFLVLRPIHSDAVPWYMELLLRSKRIIEAVNSSTFGAKMPRADWTYVGGLPICLPPPAEQRAIVRFLDHADRRIQRYIRAKETLIELLEEQKQAIIHQAVTGQSDVRTGRPYPAYKDSGVEWLGDVPEHWEVRKLLSHFRRHGSGTTPSEKEYFGGSVSWVMSGDLNDGKVDSTSRTVTRRAIGELPALKLYPPESLLVAMYGATIGRTGILSINACTNQACFVLADPFPDTDTVFFQAVLVSARRELVRRSFGGGQPNINAEVVRSFRVPSPPFSEQEAIASFVKRTAIGIDAVAMASKREIDLVREYRTRLIADVVTGKLDVREVAATFPDIDPLAANDTPKDTAELDAEL